MKIHATTTFMHGHQRFEAGQKYQLPGRTGGYFVHNGWAAALPDDEPDCIYIDIAELESEARPSADGVTLEIANVTQTVQSDKAGA